MSTTDMLTAKNVRERLQISRGTLTKMLKTGAFPNAVSMGDPTNPRRSGWRIPETDLDAFLSSKRMKPPAGAAAA